MTKMELGQIASSRVLDDRIECARSRLPVAEIAAEMANVLSARRYEIVFGRSGARESEVHHDRAMVLERRRGSGWGIS